jgi:hypothetical protein
MNMFKLRLILAALVVMLSCGVNAATFTEALTDADGKYSGPTVEDQVVTMDKDKNGFADVYEVRAYLELKHGAGYQKELLDKWESTANHKSCGAPIIRELFSDAEVNKTEQP